MSYFRKGWFLYSFISLMSLVGICGFLYLGIISKDTILGVSGVMSFSLGGALFRNVLCYNYVNSGEDKI